MKTICALIVALSFFFASPAHAEPNRTPGCVAKPEYRNTHDVHKDTQSYLVKTGVPPTLQELERRWGVHNQGKEVNDSVAPKHSKVYAYRVCGSKRDHRVVTAQVSRVGKVGMIGWWRAPTSLIEEIFG